MNDEKKIILKTITQIATENNQINLLLDGFIKVEILLTHHFMSLVSFNTPSNDLNHVISKGLKFRKIQRKTPVSESYFMNAFKGF